MEICILFRRISLIMSSVERRHGIPRALLSVILDLHNKNSRLLFNRFTLIIGLRSLSGTSSVVYLLFQLNAAILLCHGTDFFSFAPSCDILSLSNNIHVQLVLSSCIMSCKFLFQCFNPSVISSILFTSYVVNSRSTKQ